jgi:hypothetical protein
MLSKLQILIQTCYVMIFDAFEMTELLKIAVFYSFKLLNSVDDLYRFDFSH